MTNWTALHCAANGSEVAMTCLLLSFGARADIKNNLGETPLALCVPLEGKNLEVADILLDYGAYNNTPMVKLVFSAKRKQHQNFVGFQKERLLNWNYYHGKVPYPERNLVHYALAILNNTLSMLISEESSCTQSEKESLAAIALSVIYDVVRKRVDCKIGQPGPCRTRVQATSPPIPTKTWIFRQEII
jgi:ankyrin repeat protein